MKPGRRELLQPNAPRDAAGAAANATPFGGPTVAAATATQLGGGPLGPLFVPGPVEVNAVPSTPPAALDAPMEQQLRRELDAVRAAAQEALAEAGRERALLKVVLEQSPQGIVVCDAQGKLVLQNSAGQRIWQGSAAATPAAGYRAFHLDGQPYGPQDWAIARCLTTRQPTGAEELRFERFDGTHGVLLGSCAPLVGNEGLLLGAVWVFADVTHLKMVEEENRHLLQERTRFFNMVSHELANVLTPINVHVQLMKEVPASLDERQRKSLDLLDRNVERLTALLQDVLEVSRLQSGRLTVDQRPVELGRILLEAMESFQETARRQGVVLEWQGSPGLVVLADPSRVTQVLFNLLGNALKFTPPGGRVVLGTAAAGDHVVVRVRDSGPGIAPADLTRLFRPFGQVHDTSAAGAPKGTGLGLFICRGIVEALGGRIWCESEGPGKGATFAFTLPLVVEHGGANSAEPGGV